MENLELFYHRIPKEDKEPGKLIPYFIYYCEENGFSVSPNSIKQCFEELSIKPYSNISSYMSTRTRGSCPMLLKIKGIYKLSRDYKREIAAKINNAIQLPVTDNLIPLCIFDNTRQYIVSIAEQMCKCYDYDLCDAALVMMRKLLETLIIECFERHGAADEIKKDGHYLFLSELIPAFIKSKHWPVGRNMISNIPKIKKWGDTSAHTRRFIAKKSDFNDLKTELRIVLQDIVLLIDYPNWNLEKNTKKVS